MVERLPPKKLSITVALRKSVDVLTSVTEISIPSGKNPSREKIFANWCDLNENILEWGSEIIEIPYISCEDGNNIDTLLTLCLLVRIDKVELKNG